MNYSNSSESVACSYVPNWSQNCKAYIVTNKGVACSLAGQIWAASSAKAYIVKNMCFFK